MAYFLKKTKLKKGLYLQIYRSSYDPQKKYGVHTSYKTLGYVQDLIDAGIEDPISYYTAEVDKMNEEFNFNKQSLKSTMIGKLPPYIYAGYFPIRSIFLNLRLEKYFNAFQLVENLDFSIYECTQALLYWYVIRLGTRKEAPLLEQFWDTYSFSKEQILACISFLGEYHRKMSEIITQQVQKKYGFNFAADYFEYGCNLDESELEPVCTACMRFDAEGIPADLRIFIQDPDEEDALDEIIDVLKAENFIDEQTLPLPLKFQSWQEVVLAGIENKYFYEESSLQGVIFIGYLAYLLLSIFQIKVLKNKYSLEDILQLTGQFIVVKGTDANYINLLCDSLLVQHIAQEYKLPIRYATLTKTQIEKIIHAKIK
jgi:hypothetical protein